MRWDGFARILFLIGFFGLLGFPAVAVASAPVCTPLLAGVAGWWPGDGSADDASPGQGSPGDLTGGGYAPGMVGQSFDLSGGAFVEIPNTPPLGLQGALTVEGWVFPRPVNPSGGLVTKVDIGHLDDGAWYLQYEDATTASEYPESFSFAVILASGQYYRRFSTPSSVPVGQWSHIAAVTDGTAFTFYVNGQQVAASAAAIDAPYNLPAPPQVQPNAASMLLGAFQRNGSKEQFFDGLLDEMTVYHRALAPAEIQAIFAAGSAGKCKSGYRLPFAGSYVITQGPGCGDHVHAYRWIDNRTGQDCRENDPKPRAKKCHILECQAPYDGCKKVYQEEAIDYAPPERGGDNRVVATADGVVVFSAEVHGYGNLIQVRHSNGDVSFYAHLKSRAVAVGQAVRRGDLIGIMGKTGNATDVHLHFEIRSSTVPGRHGYQWKGTGVPIRDLATTTLTGCTGVADGPPVP